MRKGLFLTLALLVLLGGCGGGVEKAAGWRDIPFQEGQLYAAAYLGYRETGGLDDYTERYLTGGGLPVYHLSDGDYYLIVPRYAGTALTLSRSEVETGQTVLLCEDPDCRPFLLQCNASDIFPDAVVRLTWQGESAEFSPFLSLKDGSVDVGARGLDLTGPDG